MIDELGGEVMYKTIEDFFNSWNMEASLTQKVLDQLTDDSLKQEVVSDHWSLGKLGWHLVTIMGFFSQQMGLKFEAPAADSKVPSSAQEIAAGYRQTSQAFAEAIKTQWTDNDIVSKITFLGQEQMVSTVLAMLISHQTHHRGQMTVLMRQAGLRVPGIYGPSKEEWAEMNK